MIGTHGSLKVLVINIDSSRKYSGQKIGESIIDRKSVNVKGSVEGRMEVEVVLNGEGRRKWEAGDRKMEEG